MGVLPKYNITRVPMLSEVHVCFKNTRALELEELPVSCLGL